jgi:hypothetical protein
VSYGAQLPGSSLEVTELPELIEPVLVAGGATARQLARIAGKAQSFKLAMGSVVSFYTIQFLVDSRPTTGYGCWLPLNREVLWAMEQWMGLGLGFLRVPHLARGTSYIGHHLI